MLGGLLVRREVVVGVVVALYGGNEPQMRWLQRVGHQASGAVACGGGRHVSGMKMDGVGVVLTWDGPMWRCTRRCWHQAPTPGNYLLCGFLLEKMGGRGGGLT